MVSFLFTSCTEAQTTKVASIRESVTAVAAVLMTADLTEKGCCSFHTLFVLADNFFTVAATGPILLDTVAACFKGVVATGYLALFENLTATTQKIVTVIT
jgi:hypothetical protein